MAMLQNWGEKLGRMMKAGQRQIGRAACVLLRMFLWYAKGGNLKDIKWESDLIRCDLKNITLVL